MIEKLERSYKGFNDALGLPTSFEFFNKINELVDYVNNITDNMSELIDKVQQLADNGLALSKKVNKEIIDEDIEKVDRAVSRANKKLDLAYYYKEKLDIAIEALKEILHHTSVESIPKRYWGPTDKDIKLQCKRIAKIVLEQIQGEK